MTMIKSNFPGTEQLNHSIQRIASGTSDILKYRNP